MLVRKAFGYNERVLDITTHLVPLFVPHLEQLRPLVVVPRHQQRHSEGTHPSAAKRVVIARQRMNSDGDDDDGDGDDGDDGDDDEDGLFR